MKQVAPMHIWFCYFSVPPIQLPKFLKVRRNKEAYHALVWSWLTPYCSSVLAVERRKKYSKNLDRNCFLNELQRNLAYFFLELHY